MAVHFHPLLVKRIDPITADAVRITFAVPSDLLSLFDFKSGQFLTLRANLDGESVRRSYSICSSPAQLEANQEICVGIKRIDGGVFSSWAVERLRAGVQVDVMPPDGRFVFKQSDVKMRLMIAAGSGITPILSMLTHGLDTEVASRFCLVYGNQRTQSIMFHEALQDLKDRYPQRLQLIYMLSRQVTELPLHYGRIDAVKIAELCRSLIAIDQVDEAFVCGPLSMIESAESALQTAGLCKQRIHSERFVTANAYKSIANSIDSIKANRQKECQFSLEIMLDGKSHCIGMNDEDTVLDAALDQGLDLPYACKGGVCCTCRAKVLEGKVSMDKNYTLEQWEIDQGFVLTCQARCQTPRVVVSYDDR